MASAIEFFEDALAEAGVEADIVRQKTDVMGENFCVMKNIGGKQIGYQATIPMREFEDEADSTIKKQLAMQAEKIAEEFEEEMSTTYEWRDAMVRVSPHDGGWAECMRCKERVSAPDTKYMISDSCELSDPYPVSRDMSHELERMSDVELQIFDLYLLGLLRNEAHCQCERYEHQKI